MHKILVLVGSRFPFRLLRPVFRYAKRIVSRASSRRQERLLQRRWLRLPPTIAQVPPKVSLSEIPIVAINLPQREDRRAEFKGEMDRLGISHYLFVDGVAGKELYPRLPAHFAGAIGCNLAHSNAVEALPIESGSCIMVCEDDVEFEAERHEIEALIGAFLANDKLDVLCLAGRVRGPRIWIGSNLAVVSGVVGQACYLVKPHMVKPLARLWRHGVKYLRVRSLIGKNDHIWKRLQRRKSFFAFPTYDVAGQRSGFSDIQGRSLSRQQSTSL